jgi:two-component system response regulator AlgR
LKVLIADDEAVARQVLREMLAAVPGVEIVGEAENGAQALELADRLKPDVALLDIHMPEVDGFAVAQRLRGGRPAIIFVTAYADRAVDAFEVNAAGYLMKPVRQERLAAALAKVRPAADAGRKETLRRIVGKLGQDFHMLDIGDVIAFVADSEDVFILTAGGRYYANQTLKTLEEKLPAPPFRRIHRKTIINTDHIRRISPLSSKRWLLKLSNGMEAIVSKRMAGAIREQTQW